MIFESVTTLAAHKTCVVTAYYPLTKAKRSHVAYKEWYTIFFNCVTAPVICFCPPEMQDEFRSLSKGNVTFVIRDFYSFQMMSPDQMRKWYEWYPKDPEAHIHSPELYAIWAAKQEFVRDAIYLRPDYSTYVWCDIGCFRTVRPGNFSFTHHFVEPSKITCLDMGCTIGGGVLAGDKDAWQIFSKNYINSLESNIHGKDQDIFCRILRPDTAVIIKPTSSYGDPWFYLTYIFSGLHVR